MEIGGEFVVCSTPGGCCVGISPGEIQEELIVTLKSGAIQVYNVHDFRIVSSWQLPCSQELECGAIYHHQTQRYWAVATNQVALEWSRRDTTIKTSHALHHHAAKLLSCANEPHPLVVYCNGEVGVVEGETCWLAPKKKRWRLCLAEVLPDCRVCVVGMDKHVTVGIAQLADGQPEQPLVNNLDLKGEDLVSCCVCGDKLLLLVRAEELWVTGLQLPLQAVRCTSTIPSATPSSRLLALSCDHFIHVDSKILQLWEACYYTSQHSTDTIIPSSSKVFVLRQLNFAQVWCVEGYVYAWSSEGGLKGWRVQRSKPTLAHALGKVRLRHQSMILPSWPQSYKELKGWQRADISKCNLEYLAVLVDKAKTPSLEEFMSVFMSQPLTPTLCYFDVIDRLLSEKRFWGSEALSLLLTAGLVPSNIDIWSGITAREDWGLIYTCLLHGPTPSEQQLVTVLEKILCLPEKFECMTPSGSVHKSQLLFEVLCQPYTDVFMQWALSIMSFPKVKELLLFLCDHVSVASFLGQGGEQTCLPYEKVLDWLSVILNVHFTQLTLDHQSRQQLMALQSKISAQVTCYCRLSYLTSLEEVQSNRNKFNSYRQLHRVKTTLHDVYLT